MCSVGVLIHYTCWRVQMLEDVETLVHPLQHGAMSTYGRSVTALQGTCFSERNIQQ